jgi:hypothetical protein
MAAASTQGSLSCRASLGLILTKTIYLLKDTEKLGLYIQLIKETTTCLLDIYKVPNNPEFTELLHLCLFGFDSVSFFEKANGSPLFLGMRFLQRLAFRRSFD